MRRHDRDRYLAAGLAPPGSRAALAALYAFNLELALVRESVSEPSLGLIRLQWWRETVDGIFAGGPVPGHGVAAALAAAIRDRGLDRRPFERLIEARERDLEDWRPESVDALAAYAEATAGVLCTLAVAALGIRDNETVRDAAREAGTAYGLVGLLRAVPFHAAQRRLYLPRASLAAHGAVVAEIFEGRGGPGVARVVAEVAARARMHMRAARANRAAVPKAALPALLPLVLADHDLRRLDRVRFDVFALRPDVPVLRQLRLMYAAVRERY